MAGGAQRKGPWERLRVRLPVVIAVSPLVIAAATMLVAVIYTLFEGDSMMATLVPPPDVFAAITAIQAVPMIPFLVVAERQNRRRGAALPLHLYVLFVATFSIVFVSAMLAVVTTGDWLPIHATWIRSVVAWGVGYVAGAAIATAIVSSLIRRWSLRNASAKDVSAHF
jgi:hypothetical protein